MRDVEIELCKWLLRHENKSATPVFGVGGSDHELSLTRFAFIRFAEALNLSSRFDRINETDLKLSLISTSRIEGGGRIATSKTTSLTALAASSNCILNFDSSSL